MLQRHRSGVAFPELTIEEIMTDPMVCDLMRADHVDPDRFEELLRSLASRSLERRAVVAVQCTDHLQHVIPAELLQPLHAGFWPAKNLELALEDLTVALRERSGIGIT